MKKIHILVLVSFLLISCSPQYKIVHDYIPPASNQGLSCLDKKCHKQNLNCQQHCRTRIKHCKIQQEQAATGDYNHILDEYYAHLELYHNDMEIFIKESELYQQDKTFLQHEIDHALEFCKNKKISKDDCQDYKKFRKKLNRLHRPPKPLKPHKPALQEVVADYQQACKINCQCKQQFNQCYVSCGGQVHSRKVCIEHCD